MKKLLVRLHIHCFDSYEIHCKDTTYRQILFDGTAEGEYFKGRILPGGVDTQLQRNDGSGILSARYMLQGTDYQGNECGIYVQNEADLKEDMGNNVTRPVMSFSTDAFDFLKDKKMEGVMIFEPNDFMIDIYFEE